VFQIRIHGRGGQGVVSAAEIMSIAAFVEGRHSQAFPSFGSERMGAPVVAYCRIDDREIRAREPIVAPDVVIVQDPTLLRTVDVFAGLKDTGFVLVNSARSLKELDLDRVSARLPVGHARTIPATDLAVTHVGRPIPNAALLGAFAAVTEAVGLESVVTAIRQKFPGSVGDKNCAAAREAFFIAGEPMAVGVAP
jgi:pyruvate ferredoxin oxidoreductase gamma subunit